MPRLCIPIWPFCHSIVPPQIGVRFLCCLSIVNTRYFRNFKNSGLDTSLAQCDRGRCCAPPGGQADGGGIYQGWETCENGGYFTGQNCRNSWDCIQGRGARTAARWADYEQICLMGECCTTGRGGGTGGGGPVLRTDRYFWHFFLLVLARHFCFFKNIRFALRMHPKRRSPAAEQCVQPSCRLQHPGRPIAGIASH